MSGYGILGVAIFLSLVLIPVILETIARKRNTLPKMNNADKRFIEIKNIKTRDLFQFIEE